MLDLDDAADDRDLLVGLEEFDVLDESSVLELDVVSALGPCTLAPFLFAAGGMRLPRSTTTLLSEFPLLLLGYFLNRPPVVGNGLEGLAGTEIKEPARSSSYLLIGRYSAKSDAGSGADTAAPGALL